MTRYHINIFYSNEDKCFVADVPNLKYCSAFGATPETALHEVQKTMKNWLAIAKKINKKIPEPKYKPAVYAVGSY